MNWLSCLRIVEKNIILFIFISLAGCVTQPSEFPRLILSQDQANALRETIQPAPSDLKALIMAEVEGYILPPKENEYAQAYLYDTEDRISLLSAVMNSARNPVFLSDELFGKVQDVVSGKSAPGSFSSMLAAYMADEGYSCSHPLYFFYFEERYQSDDRKHHCASKLPFATITRWDGVKIRWIDIKRVRAIHLVFAGKGQEVASRFGHVALRLVVCPEEDSPDYDCNRNLAEHIVLGYAAHVSEFRLDYIKALQGGYHAYLFASPFMEAYQNYAIDEFREIYSLQLNIDEETKERMLRGLAGIHWNFSHEYHFFSDNCATLLQDALRVLWPAFGRDEKFLSDFIRPDSFFSKIKDSSLVEAGHLDSLDLAEQEGNYFPSTKPYYEQAAKFVRNNMTQAYFADLEGYLDFAPSYRMGRIERDESYRAKLAKDKRLLDAQLLIDELGALRSEHEMTKALALYFIDNLPTIIKEINAHLTVRQIEVFNQCLLQPVEQITKPLPRLSGIPDEYTRLELASLTVQCKSEDNIRILGEALLQIEEIDRVKWLPVAYSVNIWRESVDNIIKLKKIN